MGKIQGTARCLCRFDSRLNVVVRGCGIRFRRDAACETATTMSENADPAHAVGHSFGHIFGHHSGERGSRPVKPGSRGNFVSLRPGSSLHCVTRRRMFRGSRSFSSGYCTPFRFSWHNFLFPGEFDCFNDAPVSDPFFYGASLDTYFWSDSFSLTNSGGESLDAAENDVPASATKPAAAVPLPSNVEEPLVLLQLLDGSMYGLTRYCLQGATLHYATSYGGENSVPLERIDFAKTIELNAARVTPLDLTRNLRNP